jgi:hypothetical protein
VKEVYLRLQNVSTKDIFIFRKKETVDVYLAYMGLKVQINEEEARK